MVRSHPSTPDQRAHWVGQMLAYAGDYGFVTQLSRTSGVSRQTLYTWADQGRQALEQLFTPTSPAPVLTPALERQILTLLVESHPSYRAIQACLGGLTQQQVSLGTITTVLAEAQRRALDWMAAHAPASATHDLGPATAPTSRSQHRRATGLQPPRRHNWPYRRY